MSAPSAGSTVRYRYRGRLATLSAGRPHDPALRTMALIVADVLCARSSRKRCNGMACWPRRGLPQVLCLRLGDANPQMFGQIVDVVGTARGVGAWNGMDRNVVSFSHRPPPHLATGGIVAGQ
jgi:hypothetical protein